MQSNTYDAATLRWYCECRVIQKLAKRNPEMARAKAERLIRMLRSGSRRRSRRELRREIRELRNNLR